MNGDSISGTTRTGRYAAFISYSQKADGGFAPALQEGLQQFAKPWYRLRALRVFRDETGLAVTPELWGAIEAALAVADYFVLLASPEAAESRWVEREVDWWLTNRSAARLLIVVTDGEVTWQNDAMGFDWTRTNALPRRLAKAFAQEPFCLDLKWARTRSHLSLLHPDFADAVARLSATLRGVALDDVIGEHVRQHRQTMQLARRAGGSLALAVILGLVATYSAMDAKKAATSIVLEQEKSAASQAAASQSETLAEQAVNAVEADTDLGILLAAEAVRANPGPSAQSALRHVLYAELTPLRTFSMGDGENCFAVFHPDGKGVLTWGGKGLRLHDLASDSLPKQFEGIPNGVDEVSFSQDGRRLCTLGSDDTVRIWDTASGKGLVEWPANRAALALLSPDAARVLLLNEGMGGSLWDPATKARIAEIDFVSDDTFLSGHVQQAAFSADSSRLAVLSSGGNASVIDVRAGKFLHELADHAKRATSVAFSADDRWLVTASEDGTLRLWRSSTGQSEAVLEHGTPLHQGMFSPDGHWVAALDDGPGLVVWEVATRKKVSRIQLTPKGAGPSIYLFSPDGNCLLSASYGYDFAVLWDTRSGLRVAELQVKGRDGPIRTMRFSPDGRYVVIGAVQGPARIYRTEVCGSAAELLELAARRVRRQLTSAERQQFKLSAQK